jgi:HEAT repeat protein
MAHSPLFEEFLAGVNAPIGFSRDAIDEIPGIGALRLLDGEERIEGENILIAKLPTNDGRVASALAEVGCLRAIPALKEATTAAASPTMRVYAARALLRLGSYSGRAALIDMLRNHDGSDTDRGSAARLLAEFPDPDKEILLETASDDPDSSVRSAAAGAVLTVWRLDGDATKWGEVLLSIRGRLLSSLSSVRAEARTELLAILTRLDAGGTAEELGLTWHANREKGPLHRFVESIDRDGQDYRINGLDEFIGRERTLVENLVLLRLDKDRRAVRAAGRLGVRRAIEPLRELLRAAEGHARTEIQAVLDSLTTAPE